LGDFSGESHRDLVTVVGHAAAISAGEWITASGILVASSLSSQAENCILPHR
jgi:hypothetical protein